ncbi:B3 domain-containing transcription factor ABI3-like [Solanum dulcamara]|uniref:B3 domain-containing transcription factor ABI3-like n=1 Tax=Solanum dulcamara TaxID=45834 RepID=UPI0024855979|nr:B3 domain-containing transcription factor ABI3-like [Solanum dulcamara]
MERELHGTNNEDENTNMVASVDDDIQTSQQQDPTDFDPMDDTDIWLNENFSTDFTSLQDFPCMSSSSSTSYSPPTESDPSSGVVLKSDADEHDFDKKIDTIGDQECLNVMDNLGYIDVNEFLDPMISFLHNENPQEQQQQPPQQPPQEEDDQGLSIFQGDSELALMFFEWLKQNKDYISAEDMRSIKLKRSTIESASRRLGSTKEGKKQLLRLILDWVEQHRLQKKQMREAEAINQQTLQNSVSYNFDPNACFYPSQWIPNPPFPDSTPVMTGPIQGYIGDPYSNGSLFPPPYNQTMSGGASSPASAEYQPMDTSQSWSPSQFTMATASQFNQFPENDGTNNVAIADQTLFSTQYDPYQLFDGNGERLPRLGTCATKEARKNRMARQRRLRPHLYRHQTRNQRQITNEQSVMMGGEINNCVMTQANNPGNWVCWPSPPMAIVPQSLPLPTERTALQSQNHQKQGSADKKQAFKTEKNLKFLLQKVLKQSDVNNLGRIVLPKKEAERHLPHLETRDGISIAVEDIGTSRVWNMKYRFWPNNKSRMYLLENTGDFGKANGLQEGDFIVIYADMKCGKYLIRGVKVRQNGPKSEGKKQTKKNPRKLPSTGAISSSPAAQAVR